MTIALIIAAALLVFAAGCFAIYIYFPTKYMKQFRGRPFTGEKEVILTFDDGPDPEYTEKLLHILSRHHVCAVFFVIASKAGAYPDIIRKIIAGGHIVGLHSLEHKNAWKAGPIYTIKDFRKSIKLLNELGCSITYYRPPWQHFNLVSLFLIKKYRLKLLPSNANARDWEPESTAERVLQLLYDGVTNGSVILLHDSSGGADAAKGAPAHTLEAVSSFIPKIQAEGYRFVLPEK